MILDGFLAEVSVGHMFMAGILPGLLLAVAYGVSIAAMARLVPPFVGGSATGDAVTGALMSLREMLVTLLPNLLLIVAVLGGIYGGFSSEERRVGKECVVTCNSRGFLFQ